MGSLRERSNTQQQRVPGKEMMLMREMEVMEVMEVMGVMKGMMMMVVMMMLPPTPGLALMNQSTQEFLWEGCFPQRQQRWQEIVIQTRSA